MPWYVPWKFRKFMWLFISSQDLLYLRKVSVSRSWIPLQVVDRWQGAFWFTNKRVQIKILSILKLVSFESLAGNDFYEWGTQAEAHCERNLNRQLWSIRRKISHRCSRNFQCSQTGCLTTLFVKNKPRKLVSSLVGCLLLFLKIYVLKIGGNCRGKYQDNGKIEISVF